MKLNYNALTKEDGFVLEKLVEFFKINFSKVKFYDSILWGNYLAVLGIVSSVITLISFFLTAKDLNISVSVLIILFVVILIIIFIYMWWKANHQNYAKLKINNTKIKIEEGNIFELLEKEQKEKNEEIAVIAVNNYYDVIADNHIIAKNSLHGQYIERITKMGKLEKLNKVIDTDEILNKADNYEKISDRKKGKKVQYHIGSVVEFESYVLTAFSKFDENNKAYLNAQEYVEFWMHFWENIDAIYAGRTVNIPLIGAGITRFKNGKPSKQELLEVMLWSLKISGFHNTYGKNQIKIVIYKEDIEEIDFYHIQHNANYK